MMRLAKHGKVRSLVVVMFIGLLLPDVAAAFEKHDFPANQQADVLVNVNVKGTVYISIKTDDHKNCASFWWIKWPFGNVEQLGRHCNSVEFEVPGAFGLAVASKLRIQTDNSPTHLKVTTDPTVAHSASFKTP